MRFRFIDIISPSQNFLFAQDNGSSPDVKEHNSPFCYRQVGYAVTGACHFFQFSAVNFIAGNTGRPDKTLSDPPVHIRTAVKAISPGLGVCIREGAISDKCPLGDVQNGS